LNARAHLLGFWFFYKRKRAIPFIIWADETLPILGLSILLLFLPMVKSFLPFKLTL
jgi:hypothetical protein